METPLPHHPACGSASTGLGCVDLKFEFGVQLPQIHHHPLTGFLAAHIDLAVLSVTRKVTTPRRQRLLHFVEQQMSIFPAFRYARISRISASSSIR